MRDTNTPEDALRRRALEMLNRRAMSRRELMEKLVQKGETKEAAEATAEWIAEMRLLDDESYAEEIVRHYAAKGYGQKRIEQELWRRGIEKDLWDTALEAMPEEDDSLDRFIQLKLRGVDPDKKEEKRLADALARRGYSWDEISAGVRRYREGL
ncbi:MAG: recombination regulator RecX [Oscillospiraceae bacterium]|nr:recombination regulator RecX [Oscillospiraceae bacterium]